MKNVVVTRLLAIVFVLLLATGCAGPKSFLDATGKFSEAAVKATATTQTKLSDHENYLRAQYLNDVLFFKEKNIDQARLYYFVTNKDDQEAFYTDSHIEFWQIKLLNDACCVLQTYADLLNTIAKGESLDTIKSQSASIFNSVQNSMTLLQQKSIIDSKVVTGFKQVSDLANLLASKILEAQQEKLLRDSITKAAPHVSSIVQILKEETHELQGERNSTLNTIATRYILYYDSSASAIERSYWLERIDASIAAWHASKAQLSADNKAYESFLKAHDKLVQYANKKISLDTLLNSVEIFSQFATAAFSISQSPR